MAARKRRTRQHIIADLSCNHIERIALLCGYSVERVRADYGNDLILFTYDEHGEPETGLIYIQAKATDKLSLLAGGATISIRV